MHEQCVCYYVTITNDTTKLWSYGPCPPTWLLIVNNTAINDSLVTARRRYYCSAYPRASASSNFRSATPHDSQFTFVLLVVWIYHSKPSETAETKSDINLLYFFFFSILPDEINGAWYR